MKRTISILTLMAAFAATNLCAVRDPVVVVVDIVGSTSTNSTIIMVANPNTEKRAEWGIAPMGTNIHWAVGREVTTNIPLEAVIGPTAPAPAGFYQNNTGKIHQGTVAARSSSTNSVRGYYWIIYE